MIRSSSRVRGRDTRKGHRSPLREGQLPAPDQKRQEHRAEVIDLAQIEEDQRILLPLERLENQLRGLFLETEGQRSRAGLAVMTVISPWRSIVNASSEFDFLVIIMGLGSSLQDAIIAGKARVAAITY